jgi:hypothetical protein
MGGHGGLNILPQKKWNVYNWDNRIKVMENEKVVEGEIKKLERKNKDKGLRDIVKQIKNPNEKNYLNFHKNNIEIDDKEKNKIFKEVMSRQSMEKKLNVDLFFEKMNTPMKPDQQLKLFDEDFDVKKLANPNQEEGIVNVTLKDSVKNHLNPWWMKKNPADYEFYRDIKIQENESQKKCENTNSFKKEECGDDKFLKKKHRKEKKHKKDKMDRSASRSSSSSKDDKNKKLEKLRKERLEREMREKERINKFLHSNSNSNFINN